MTKRDYGLYIQDIVDTMNKIEQFIYEMSYSEFVTDAKTVFDVTRAIEIIGEVVKTYLRLGRINTRQYRGELWLVCAII